MMEELVNLKQFRQTYNLTQAKAAERIGIDQRQWNRYENGRNELPIRYLKAICMEYGVSADWLLGLSTKQQLAQTEDEKRPSQEQDPAQA